MTKILAVVAFIFATISPAQAWGDREQGILAGIAATLLWQHVGAAQQPQQPPVAVGGYPQQYPQPYPQQYPYPVPQQPRVIVVPPQPQVIIVPGTHTRGHRHGHYGYYQLPDPRVYRPQQY